MYGMNDCTLVHQLYRLTSRVGVPQPNSVLVMEYFYVGKVTARETLFEHGGILFWVVHVEVVVESCQVSTRIADHKLCGCDGDDLTQKVVGDFVGRWQRFGQGHVYMRQGFRRYCMA